VESKTLETPPSLPQEHQEQPRQSEKTDVKVYIVSNRTEELYVEKQNAGNTAPAAHENNHAESEKIAVKVYKKKFAKVSSRNKSEELAVESRKLEAPPSLPPRTPRTSTPCLRRSP
jgi:hypothetical protein